MSRSMPAIARRRMLFVALLGAAIGCVLLATVLIGGANAGGPATGAAALVPGDALVYVHVSTDRGRTEVNRALALARRFPDYARLSAVLQTRAGAAQNLRPWLGREAAFAQLDAGSLIVLDLRDRAAAQKVLIRAGATGAGRYHGRPILREATGQEVAFVKHYAVIGPDASVRAGLDAASSPGGSLQASSGYQRAAAGEPSDRVLDAYISAVGVRRLLQGRRGLAGAAGMLLGQQTLLGATVSLSPAARGFHVRIHSAFDAGITGLNGHGPTAFTPSLERVIPSGTPLMLDLTGLDRAAPQLLGAGAAAGIGATIGPLLSRLGAALSAEGVNVPQLLSLFRGETAVAVSPAAGGTPSLLIVARTNNAEGAREALAMAEPPLAHLFDSTASQAGQASLLNDVSVGPATVHQLALAPGLQLDYTVSDGLVVIGTSLHSVAGVLQHARALADDGGYRSVLPSHPAKVTSLLFLDFTHLLNLVEQAGLTRGTRFTALRPDLQMIRAVGLQSTSGEADSTAELLLQIQ